VLCKGSTFLGDVIENAWKRGAKFDNWTDYFNFNIWMEAFIAEGVI